MPFLGLVGVPAAEISYGAFRAAVNAGGVFGAELAAAEATAVVGLTTAAAAVVGSGLAGIAIGQAILRGLERPDTPLPVRQLYKVAGGQGRVGVVFDFEFTNGVPHPQYVEVDAPFVGVLAEIEAGGGGRTNYYLLSPPATRTGLALIAAENVIVAPYIVSATKLSTGQPAEALKIPSYPPTPLRSPVKVPTAIPIPGLPDFPISPEIIPYTPAPIEKPGEEKVPGIIIQIPETGTQIAFTPTGVRISNYSAPSTVPYEVPQTPPPPTDKKIAEPPCPCPEQDSTEVLCRLKALEKGLLDDGYDYTTRVYTLGGGANIDGISDEFYSLTIEVIDSAEPIKKQRPSGSSDTVWFAGWYTFRIAGKSGDRNPISYQSSTYFAPSGATGFGVSIAYFGTAIATVVTRKLRDYADNC